MLHVGQGSGLVGVSHVQNPLQRLTLEDIQQLGEAELLDAAEVVTQEVETLRRVSGLLNSEIVRRAKTTGASRVVGGGVICNITTARTYKWNAEKALELLKPVSTPEELGKAVKTAAPPPPPKVKLTVHTQAALAIARKAGLVEAIKECYTLEESAPALAFERVVATIADDEVLE